MKLFSADSSKKSLTSIPFKGKLLFGPDLDKIFSQAAGGKSMLLPQPKARPSFRRGRFFVAPKPKVQDHLHQDNPSQLMVASGASKDHPGKTRNTSPKSGTSPLQHDGVPSPSGLTPIGRRLSLFSEARTSTVQDAWIHKVFLHVQTSARAKRLAFQYVISNLSRVITPVPPGDCFKGYY